MPYPLILVPLIAMLSAQIIKLAFDGVKGNLDVKHVLNEYGGMPSSHAALVVALTTGLGLQLGLRSPIFACAFIFSLVMLRDAFGFRRFVGENARVLRQVAEELPSGQRPRHLNLVERTGHKFSEIAAGCLWGFLLAYWLI